VAQNREFSNARRMEWSKANPERETVTRKKTYYKSRNKVLVQMAAYRQKHAERLNAKARQYRAEHLAEKTAYLEQYRAANVAKANAYAKQYRADNAEKLKQWRLDNVALLARLDKEYRKAHPEKAAEKTRRRRAIEMRAEGSHTRDEWLAMVEHFNGYCVCCGKHFGVEGLTEDHVVPLTWGGSEWIQNIQPLCTSCNCSKGNRHATDYRKTPFTGNGQQRLFG
jgi:5-methylcytosine-specific restriction endonuclease McrA